MSKDFQSVYNDLYTRAKNNECFTDLKSLILDKQNIIWAIDNIKNSINFNELNSLSVDDIVIKIHDLCSIKYMPHTIIVKQIILKDGKKQYIGVPTIWDKLIQQCIKQILEPICEAHFYKYNYSFKPNCITENIISVVYNRLQLNKVYNVIKLDINDFYNKINHSKLIKQLWTLGVHDKWLLYQIRNILLTPVMYNKQIAHPKQGIIQSGILHQLFLSIALNEFDHWIKSQWEENPVINNYSNRPNKNNIPNKGHAYCAMRKRTKLKEMYLVRYNDNILIFVKSSKQIDNIKIAISKWFNKRLKYQLSLNDIYAINTTKKYFEFLGFKIRTIFKRNKYVVESHINDYQLNNLYIKLKKQIVCIQHLSRKQNIYNEIAKYNDIVLFIHMYYRVATHINNDCSKLDEKIRHIIYNRLQGIKKAGRKLNLFENKYYGKSKMLRYIHNEPIYPIGYVQHKYPIGYKYTSRKSFDFEKK